MRIQRAALSILLVLTCDIACIAQDPAKPDPPTAVPARPTVTTPASLPPVGYLQFEQGFDQANSSPGLDHQFSLVQNTKLALHPHVLVQVITQPFARTLLPPISKDQGDVLLGGQVLLTPAPKAAPADKATGVPAPSHAVKLSAVSLGYTGRVRSGTSADLDIGSFSQGLLLLADGSVPGLTFQTNFIVNEQSGSDRPGHTTRRAQLGQTLSISRQFNPKYSLTGELWHFTQPFVSTTRKGSPIDRANAVGLLFAGGYTVRNNLVLDAGFERGLTTTSTAWQGFAGFTYLLPHRLFGHDGPH